MLSEKQLLKCIPHIRKYAWSLAGSDSEDLVQDVLCRAWAKRHLFIEGDAVAWCLTIAHNQHVNNVRKALRESGSASEDVQAVQEAQTAHLVALEVRDAIEQLPEHQQDVLIFAAIHGEQYAEAAAMFAIPIGTVRSRLWRGRDSLRRKFA